jgi:hypothetical protein
MKVFMVFLVVVGVLTIVGVIVAGALETGGKNRQED